MHPHTKGCVRACGREKGDTMALLVGQHLNGIDKKGRVSVPKPFRAALEVEGFAGIYAYPLFKFPAVEACGEAFMTRLSASLDQLDMFSDDQDDLAAVILENAHALAFDTEGRITLPEPLIAAGGFTSKALFVGRGGRFQIWAPNAYKAHRADAFERARARGITLKLQPDEEGRDG